jgi:hypothetical protein
MSIPDALKERMLSGTALEWLDVDKSRFT